MRPEHPISSTDTRRFDEPDLVCDELVSERRRASMRPARLLSTGRTQRLEQALHMKGPRRAGRHAGARKARALSLCLDTLHFQGVTQRLTQAQHFLSLMQAGSRLEGTSARRNLCACPKTRHMLQRIAGAA